MSFDIMPYAGNDLSGFSFFIAKGAAWNTSAHLFDFTLPNTAAVTPGTWLSIDTSTADINLTAAQQFVIGWTSSGGSGLLANSSGNAYTGGGFWNSATAPASLRNTMDLAFQTHMENGVAVPEPSTYVAGALMLLPFGMQGIRRLLNRQQMA